VNQIKIISDKILFQSVTLTRTSLPTSSTPIRVMDTSRRVPSTRSLNPLPVGTNVTANRSLSVIKKVFKHGLKIRAVANDVSKQVSFLSEKEHVRNRFLLPARLDQLIEATQSNRGKFYMPSIIYLGAEHGASKQEVLSLEWSDIDFEFQDVGLIRFFRTKNTKERTEFLMPRTRKALLDWKAHLEWKRHRIKVAEVKSDNVFCRIDGTPLKNFNKAWWACLKAAGIKDFHFHDLRHTFCSNLIMSGGGLKDAKEMIGHADISITTSFNCVPSKF
jgi:integrase